MVINNNKKYPKNNNNILTNDNKKSYNTSVIINYGGIIFMKIVGEQGVGKVLKVFLKVCFYVGIVILIGLPFIMKILGSNFISILVFSMFVYPIGIILLMITYNFIAMFDSLRLNNPFCKENVKLLKRTGIISLVGSAFWLIYFIFGMSLLFSEFHSFKNPLQSICFLAYFFPYEGMFLFLCILFLGVSIALYILSELFKQATEYKDENDLTI